MIISNATLRIADYYKRYGFGATVRRGQVALFRSLFSARMVVFYYDLDERTLPRVKIPDSLKVERLRALNDLSYDYLQKITSVWAPKLADQKVRERFAKGATLWLVEYDGRLAGYGWTLRGTTIAPYYFPMGPDDVQLFDFFVFPEFRGRALHWFLTVYILKALTAESGGRAYADTHEWNEAQLASFKMTPFRRLGIVRTYQFFGRQLTHWVVPKQENKELKSTPQEAETLNARRSNA
jgi:hypothetical protein